MNGQDSASVEVFSSDPVIALKELIALYQAVQVSWIELAAELVGVSKRTLQRYLNSKSTSYSQLIAQVRFELAKPLLHD
jgi:AraC-like DNA-binding protein